MRGGSARMTVTDEIARYAFKYSAHWQWSGEEKLDGDFTLDRSRWVILPRLTFKSEEQILL